MEHILAGTTDSARKLRRAKAELGAHGCTTCEELDLQRGVLAEDHPELAVLLRQGHADWTDGQGLVRLSGRLMRPYATIVLRQLRLRE